MANEILKELKTKIALKTLPLLGENSWESIKDTYKPLKGEVCICEIPQDNANATTAPTILFKVGDGTSTWGQLKWASALAADVYDWAKKPQAEFITWVNTVVEHPAAPVITTGNGNGTIAVNGTDVAVKGLGSAAYTNADAYATSTENGAKQAAADAQKTIDDYAVAHKDDYTNKQIDDAIAAVDTGVHAVDLATGDANGQIKLTVDGESKNVDVKGLASAAYVTVESLNATAKGYADDVEAKLPTSANYGVLDVTAGTGIEVTGDAQHPVVGVKANTYDVYGAAGDALEEAKEYTDEALAAAKKYADDNDANTEYHVEYDSTSKKIKLVAGADADKMEIDATAFIKDGMIESVELVQEDDSGNKDQFLKLTWNDDGKDVTYVSVGELVDVYTATENATEVQVAISNENKVSATLVNGGVSTAKIADDAVTADKLADTINIDIAKGVDAQGRVAVLEAKTGLDKVGTVTSITAGGGLTGGTITESGTIALDDIIDLLQVSAVKVEAGTVSFREDKVTIMGGSRLITYDFSDSDSGPAYRGYYGWDGLEFDDANGTFTIDLKKDGLLINDKVAGLKASLSGKGLELTDSYDQNLITINRDDEDKAQLQLGGTTVDETELAQLNTPLATAERVKALEDANHISEITTTENGGLKVTNKNQIDIDDEVVFVINCNW